MEPPLNSSARCARARPPLPASERSLVIPSVVQCEAMLQPLQQPVHPSFGGPIGAHQSVEMEVHEAAMQVGRSAGQHPLSCSRT